ncbi:diaminopimelate epimerase [Gluconobacter albidus]|uniref:diaminopimelate epimerase n=1 Tax=Gluconobacter TaxID=441 RepID=UPI00098A9684|nr:MULTISPECIES: diaminopimelate epimerase [Gluconobacter]AQS92194.1 diaminopimelate epimerase [Gluconobacter albidus]OUI81057.1 diaminopimelate epimerase [Gluconobacter sp. DsW_056]
MSLSFTKMHGLGNDFVVIDARQNDPALDTATIRHLCDRRFGIGCDQLVLLTLPTLTGADVHVRFFNPDGSEAGACGNASRCVVKFVGGAPTLQTAAGLLPTARDGDLVTVDMGLPHLDWQDVPLSQACDTLHLPLPTPLDAAACSMGNPHATIFGDASRAEALGAGLEQNALFPERANIGFAQMLSPTHMRLRVWERGAGLTLACGSGACAAVVNAVRRGLTERTCTVTMDGGDLHITWRADGHVLMTGPAVTVFHGTTA